jgi:hypothetical protein
VKGFRGGNLRKVDNEVEADDTKAITPIFSGLETESILVTTETEDEYLIGRAELVTPTFLQLELVAATEAIDARESDSPSVKEEECGRIYGGSTAGGPHVNG